jgi:serine/threonine protein kinase/tetratricopeptide (TPR) repeat protein
MTLLMERDDEADAFAQTVAPEVTPQVRPPGGSTPPSGAPTDVRPPSSRVIVGSIAGDVEGGDSDGLPEIDTALYETDRELARGGMGRIVSARDRRLGRAVALKELIHVGPEHAIRFRREALITARLQHPGIVPVYEAGRWPSGEPFFAMKLVAGKPLDKVIAAARTLPDRLALLPRVLAATEAIAYAHSQRVIHRDLKPANILVGDFGETVVIDWGLAKDLDASEDEMVATGMRRAKTADETAARTAVERRSGRHPTIDNESTKSPSDASTLTVVGSVMGTPAYMAPEQARGDAVDERADVFSLGAMLYHLLAGQPPYEAKTATDVIAAAVLGNVTPLGERAPDAPPDLLAIVTRAMTMEPVGRYATAGELADELRRFLTGQLVASHRYTTMQRVRRFVRKHRAAVSIAVIAALGFAVGGTLAVRKIVVERDRAEHQRKLAEIRKLAAERLVDFMQSDLTARLEPIGRLDLLVPVGAEVRRYYDALGDIPGGMQPMDVDRMAKALLVLASTDKDAGNLDAGVAGWQDAKERLVALIAQQPKSKLTFERKLLVAEIDLELGNALHARGKMDEATARFVSTSHALGELLREQPDHRRALLVTGETRDRLGDLLRNTGKVDEAIAEYTTARLVREQITRGQNPVQDREAAYAQSRSHMKLGSVHYARGESQQALTEYRSCSRLREQLLDDEPDNPKWLFGVIECNDLVADMERELSQIDAAIATYEETVDLADILVHRDPANTLWKRARGNILQNFGFLLLDAGDFRGALDRFRAALDNHRELVGRDPANTSWQVDLSRMFMRSGDAHLALGDTDAALAALQESRAIRKALVDREPTHKVWRRLLAWSAAKLAHVYAQKRDAGDADRAIDSSEEALALRKALSDESPSHALLRNELASSEIGLGRLLVGSERATPGRARELIASGVERAGKLVDGDPVNSEFKETLVSGLVAYGAVLVAADDADTARAHLERARGIAEAVIAGSPKSVLWLGSLAEALDTLGDIDKLQGKYADERAHRRAAFAALDKAGDRLPAFRKPLYDRLKAWK